MAKLKDKVVIITGGVSGIGAASAELFAEEGAKLVLVDMNEELGNSFVEELKGKGHEAIFMAADVTDHDRVKEVFETTRSTYGKLDILFNNAGIGEVKPSEELDYAEWRKTVEIDRCRFLLVTICD